MHPGLWLALALSLAVACAPVEAAGEIVSMPDGVAVEFDLPKENWQVFRKAPEFLVTEIAHHLEHELEAAGKKLSEQEIRQAAEKRLSANEAFVCNPATGACLTIDFSPLKKGENPPSRRAVALSAKYAGEGLTDEEGVSGLEQKSGEFPMSGAEVAYRVDARYRLHGEPRQFIGVIGFERPNWFFLYYTDPLRRPHDLQEMERVLSSFAVRREGGE